ncbi:dihydrofolate reductase, partial [Escherichia coli]|nr:dihydrofolate reductase [Escherichia coli]
LEELFEALDETADDDIMIIGGEQIYRQLLPYCNRAYVTRWDAEAEADAFVPDLDVEEGWLLLEESPPRTEGEDEE